MTLDIETIDIILITNCKTIDCFAISVPPLLNYMHIRKLEYTWRNWKIFISKS